jgi:hypothetical protein
MKWQFFRFNKLKMTSLNVTNIFFPMTIIGQKKIGHLKGRQTKLFIFILE